MGTQQWDRPEQRAPGPENLWHQVLRRGKLEVVRRRRNRLQLTQAVGGGLLGQRLLEERSEDTKTQVKGHLRGS